LNSEPEIVVEDNSATNITLEIGNVEDYTVDTSSNEAVFSSIDIGSSDYGTYEIIAYTNGNDSDTISRSNVVLDGGSPEASFDTPGDDTFISDDNPDIEASFEDTVSGLTRASIRFDASGDDVNESNTFTASTDEESLEIDFSDNDYDSLDDGSYTVDYEAFDEAGNSVDSSWSFTVDTSYDGPEDFSFDPSPGIINVDEDDREVDVTVDEDYDDDTGIDVECRVDGDEEDSTSIDADGSDGDEFTCDIPDDFDGQMFDLELYLEDQAGNSYTSDEVEFGFDDSPAFIDNLESVSDVSTFNEDFKVDYSASDDVSDIQTVEYYIDDDPGVDEGTQFTEASKEVSIDTSDLDEGEHTLYIRAEDDFGKWGSSTSLDFDFYPDEEPEGSIDVVEELNVTTGSRTDLEVEVSNTGVILLPGGEVTVSDFGGNASYDTVSPDESSTVGIELEPKEDDLGEHTLDVSVESVEASKTVDVLVKANNSLQDNLESELDSYEEDYEELSSEIEDLRSQLSEARTERIDESFSSFESGIEDARSAEENSEYYEVSEVIQDLDSQMQSVRDTMETVEEEQNVADRNKIIGAVLGLFVLFVGGGAVYVVQSDEYELDVSGLQDVDFPVTGGEEDDESDEQDFNPESDDQQTGDEDGSGLFKRVKHFFELKSSDEKDVDGPDYEFK